MLTIALAEKEMYDEVANRFIQVDPIEVHLEHSLISLSKWEAKFHKPFMSSEQKTTEETMAYIKDMIIDDHIPERFDELISDDNIKQINAYLKDERTATIIHHRQDRKGPGQHKTMTSEVIYAGMILRRIPIELETWNLNRLMKLMQVIDIEQNQANGGNKMSRAQSAAWQRQENARRLQQSKK